LSSIVDKCRKDKPSQYRTIGAGSWEEVILYCYKLQYSTGIIVIRVETLSIEKKYIGRGLCRMVERWGVVFLC